MLNWFSMVVKSSPLGWLLDSCYCTSLCITLLSVKLIPGHTTRRWKYFVPQKMFTTLFDTSTTGVVREVARERSGVPDRPMTSY